MQRIPEPEELMDHADQALAYAQADFSDANQLFVELLEQLAPHGLSGHLLDLGCGPADIPLRLARCHPGLQIDALDGAPAMLELARQALAAEPEAGARIELLCEYLPCPHLARRIRDLSPALHCFGHVHNGRGRQQIGATDYLNATSVNSAFEIAYPPFVVDLPDRTDG